MSGYTLLAKCSWCGYTMPCTQKIYGPLCEKCDGYGKDGYCLRMYERDQVRKVMEGVNEYGEESDVQLGWENGRYTVEAFCEGGFAGTAVDLVQLLIWVKANMPDVWGSV